MLEQRADQADPTPLQPGDGLVLSRRVDRAELAPAQVSKEGFLHVEGFVARPGVYVYRNADGTRRRELVPASTLHDPASLATLARKPVVLGHASDGRAWVWVDPSNVQVLGVGLVDGPEGITIADDGRVIVGMTVTRRDAIDAIRAGTHELSPQYDARVAPQAGVDPMFGAYDCIQTWREYNGVAVVPLARGGRNLYLRADSADAEIADPTDNAPEGAPGADMIIPPAILALLTLGLVKRSDGLAADAPATEGMTFDASDMAARCDAYDKIADAVGMKAGPPAGVVAHVSKLHADSVATMTARADEADKATAKSEEAARLAYADERRPLVDLAAKLEVTFDGVANADLRKALAMKVRPEARADAADDYYRGIIDVASSSAGDPLAGLRFDGKVKPPATEARADGDETSKTPAAIRHAIEAFEAAAPKPRDGSTEA
jgi:hypothetical protein